jgi:hypothetical protein
MLASIFRAIKLSLVSIGILAMPPSGINNTAIGKTPFHRFTALGNYSVQAIVNFDCGVDTL